MNLFDPGAITAAADPALAAAADPASTFDLSGLLAFWGLVGTGAPDSVELSQSFQQYVYDPLHTLIQDWINSQVGQFVDNGAMACSTPRATSAG